MTPWAVRAGGVTRTWRRTCRRRQRQGVAVADYEVARAHLVVAEVGAGAADAEVHGHEEVGQPVDADLLTTTVRFGWRSSTPSYTRAPTRSWGPICEATSMLRRLKVFRFSAPLLAQPG
jgi:hypothetical protein